SLFRAKYEIGVVRGGLIIVDDDVGPAVAAERVPANPKRVRFTARDAAQAHEPTDDVTGRLSGALIDLLRRDRSFHRRRALCRSGDGVRPSGRGRRRGGHSDRTPWLRIRDAPILDRTRTRLALLLPSEPGGTNNRDLRLTAVGGAIRTEVPRFVDEVPVFAALISHD